MTNSNPENFQSQKNFPANNRERYSKGRYGGNRDSGGFRIRLSENEMKAVKSIQDTFNLKSTVAVLGFSVRTLSEMIKDESIKKVVIDNANKSNQNIRQNNSFSNNGKVISQQPDPFARPTKKETPELKEIQNSELDEK
tara:strand:+ start:1252 stop:1668 length:417 start_codon:yes stop_codon:yes gene_type:complete